MLLQELNQRKSVILSARVHPGETVASIMMQVRVVTREGAPRGDCGEHHDTALHA